MTKIMVVEDDQSLREIYSIRLTAEGYEIVSAGDGEEALALAVKEKPDLILSDVMMPKISGFDMLDILRQTPETKNIKVIMMTALSSDDQRKRGEGLGADKYLVKSQVGIEDVIAAVHEVLDGTPAEAAAQAAGTAQPSAGQPVPMAAAPSVAQPAPEQPAGGAPVAQPIPVQPMPETQMPGAQPMPVAAQPAVQPAQPVSQPMMNPVQGVENVQPTPQSVQQPTQPNQPVQQ